MGFWSYVKKGVSAADSFFVLRALSIYQYGVYQLLLTSYAILSDVFLDLFATVSGNDVILLVGQGKEAQAKKLYFEYARFRLLMALIPFLGIFFFAPIFFTRYGPEAIVWIRILSLLFIVDAASNLFRLALNLRLDFKTLAIMPTTQKSIQLVFLVYFYFFSNLSLTNVIFSLVAAPIISILVFSPALRRAFAPWRHLTPDPGQMFVPVIRTYGFWEVPQLLFKGLTGKVSPFVIKLFLNTEAVGIFGVANTAISILKDLLPIRTLTTLIPRKAADRKYSDYLFRHGTKHYTLMSLVVSVAGLIFYPVAIYLFFPKFSASIPIFSVLILGVPIFAFVKLLAVFLVAKRRQRFIFYQMIFDNVVGISLMLLFLPFWGLMGMAVASVSADFITDAGRFIYLVKTGFVRPFSFRTLFRWTEEDSKIYQNVWRHFRQAFLDKISGV